MRRDLALLFLPLMLATVLLCAPTALAEEGAPLAAPESAGEELLLPVAPDGLATSETLAAQEELGLVCNETELAEWVASHLASGGEVVLGNTITIANENIWGIAYGTITISTGPYGLVYDGRGLHLLGDVHIIGEGVNVPVLDIASLSADPYMRHWNMMLQEAAITATGKEGVGGTAVRVRQDDSWSLLTDVMEEKRITSYGEGAVGLELMASMDVYCLNITVQGEDSIAVLGELGVSLHFCKLNADDGKAIKSNGAVLLDTCAVKGDVPQGASVLQRHIVDAIGEKLYYPVAQDDFPFISRMPRTFQLSAGCEPLTLDLLLDYDQAVLWDMDTGILGRTEIPCSLFPPYQGLGLEHEFPINIIIDVRDRFVPSIYRLIFGGLPGARPFVEVYYFGDFSEDDGELLLWRSHDGGTNWENITKSPDVYWNDWGCFIYSFDEISRPVKLQLELCGKGESNVVTLYSVDKRVNGDIGGDRTGTDRGGNPGDGGTSGGTDGVNNAQPSSRAAPGSPIIIVAGPEGLPPEGAPVLVTVPPPADPAGPLLLSAPAELLPAISLQTIMQEQETQQITSAGTIAEEPAAFPARVLPVPSVSSRPADVSLPIILVKGAIVLLALAFALIKLRFARRP